ncbi:5'/3'-nucleotidase SurE [Jannaschia aquimarina]|uniref:5'-nucleotidase SurE n=1 Tax=Jannaschia aquimarina TaxID=935700 RepID=A0A0D1ECK6_9RHOB|nr:5'/3'-nucleotidase SurE [Jannaschia aquimarina]KIT14661.1 5'-nucleotidase SurE [Jannaschia aquimarina]SNT37799.1 5'-nucleotidase /3'-nucleotidase /exopolyphosphatase [Jannaschia aquimarina]
MRILITNDDGIGAPGLEVLTEIAHDVAGPDGEVWTVAPAFEQSGVGHAINYVRPSMVQQIGPRRIAVEGSPADCVLAGLGELVDGPVDLVLSGVNRGNNAGENTIYSGTIGAAIEAALQGVNAIALSQFYGPRNVQLDDPFEAARATGADLVRRLIEGAPWGGDTYKLFYNVNFPPVPADGVRGALAVSQGYRGDGRMGVTPQTAPSGRKYLWISGSAQGEATAEGTDVHANVNGWTSVTPMRCDLTDHEVLAAMNGVLDSPTDG